MINKRYVLISVVTLVLAGVFTVYVVGGLTGRIKNDFPVTVTFDHVGQLLRVTGDVKLRGVLIGKIQRIDHLPDGKAQVRLALDPTLRIPADVSAAVRGKTLFGEKFVELIDAPHPSGAVMRSGAVIPESRTTPPFELEQVLQSLLPVLDAAKPGDFGGALHALATGLAGNEETARRAIDNTLVLLDTLAANKGSLDRLLGGMDTSTGAISSATPDLIKALNDLDTLSKELIADQGNLRAVLHDTPTWLDVAAGLVEERYKDLVDLSVKGASILDLVAAHRTALPMTVDGLKKFTQDWVTNLSTPCEDATGATLGDSNKFPTLAGTTCWQVWILAGEKDKMYNGGPGGYSPGDRPQPGPAVATAAYHAQLGQLLGLPFGTEPTALQLFFYSPIRDAQGLIPGGLL